MSVDLPAPLPRAAPEDGQRADVRSSERTPIMPGIRDDVPGRQRRVYTVVVDEDQVTYSDPYRGYLSSTALRAVRERRLAPLCPAALALHALDDELVVQGLGAGRRMTP
jgi:hypothetical protein